METYAELPSQCLSKSTGGYIASKMSLSSANVSTTRTRMLCRDQLQRKYREGMHSDATLKTLAENGITAL